MRRAQVCQFTSLKVLLSAEILETEALIFLSAPFPSLSPPSPHEFCTVKWVIMAKVKKFCRGGQKRIEFLIRATRGWI